MYQHLEGELFKVLKIENGFNVVVYDPELSKPTLPGQPPCSQQPMRWWRTYSFATHREAVVFVGTFMESLDV